jgi:type I restriction enzyme M protein
VTPNRQRATDLNTARLAGPAQPRAGKNGAAGDLPFAKTLFEAADRLRGSVESAEYKHLVLGLLFLKYVSDSYMRRRYALDTETRDETSELFTQDETERETILEDRDEYAAENVFWVPAETRWEDLLAAATQPDIGSRIDRALEAIERENPDLRGVLPRIYARAPLPVGKLGELLTTIAKVGFGDDEETARDVLGRTYEYFIKTFARQEGHRGGEFYTPASVTKLLVEMVEPFAGRVYEPAFGSAGLFIQSGRFVEAHGGRPQQLAVYGQENNQATWRIGKMNLAIHGLTGELRLGNTLLDDQLKDLRADYILANPPFNQKKWGAAQVADDVRWKYGAPPDGNANYAWIQHFVHHLAPDGRAGFVMANRSLSDGGVEGKIRESIVHDDVIDCIVALPQRLFFTTGIPVCLWFLARNKASAGERARRGEILFIDARSFGVEVSRTQIELTPEEIGRIARTYHAWRGQPEAGEYEDVSGFCATATIDQIAAAGYRLTPNRYVPGAPGGEAELNDVAEALTEVEASMEAMQAASASVDQRIDELADLANAVFGRVDGFSSGWRLVELHMVAERIRGSVNPLPTPDEIFEHFSIPAFDLGAGPEITAGATIKSAKTPLPESGAVLVSKLNPNTPRVWWARPGGHGIPICSGEFVALVPRDAVPLSYLLAVVRHYQSFWDHIHAHVTGTTGSRQRVKPDEVMKAVVPLPPPERLAEFDALFAPVFEWEDVAIRARAGLDTVSALLLSRVLGAGAGS